MAYLVDSNCLLRLAETRSPQRQIVLSALGKLYSSGETLCVTPQILAEFWNVCTRPASARGGLNLDIASTERKLRLIEKHFTILHDSLATFVTWRRLISVLEVKGVQVHDARIAASMLSHNVTHVLTFNVTDFRRFSGIKVVDPTNV